MNVLGGIVVTFYDGSGNLIWGKTLLVNGLIIATFALLGVAVKAIGASKAPPSPGPKATPRPTPKPKPTKAKDASAPTLRSSIRPTAEASAPDREITPLLAAPTTPTEPTPAPAPAPTLRISIGRNPESPTGAPRAGTAGPRLVCPSCSTVIGDDLICPACGHRGGAPA